VRAEVSSEKFKDLVSAGYREDVYHDPKALEQQIPFYSIKVGYVAMIRLLGRIGVAYSKSTYIISSLFSALSIFILAILVAKARVSIVALPMIVLPTGLLDLARLSTPDSIACFVGLLSLLTLLVGRSNWSLLLAAVMPLARTDFILLSCLVVGYALYQGIRLPAIISSSISFLSYLTITNTHANYSWITLFNFTFIGGLTPYPADLVVSQDITQYLRPYLTAATHTMFHLHFPIFMAATYALFQNLRNLSNQHEVVVLAILPMLFVVLHLVLYPAYYHRFFVFAAAVVFVWLLSQIRVANTPTISRVHPS
jgi:hypothetical protein